MARVSELLWIKRVAGNLLLCKARVGLEIEQVEYDIAYFQLVIY